MANIHIITKPSGKPIAICNGQISGHSLIKAIKLDDGEIVPFAKWQQERNNRGLSKGFANAMARVETLSRNAICFIAQETALFCPKRKKFYLDDKDAEWNPGLNLVIAKPE